MMPEKIILLTKNQSVQPMKPPSAGIMPWFMNSDCAYAATVSANNTMIAM